jgi:hypothetical protein
MSPRGQRWLLMKGAVLVSIVTIAVLIFLAFVGT